MTGDRLETRRGASNRRKVLISALLALPALELVARGYWFARGEPYGAAAAIAAMERLLEAMSPNLDTPTWAGESDRVGGVEEDAYLPHPYFGWDSLRGQEMLAQDLAYFRSRAPLDTYDVLVIGSSVAAGFGNHGRARFLEVLAEDPRFADEKVRVCRYGRGAFKQPQQLMLLCYLLSLGFRPDAVICIDGLNELALGVTNDARGTHPSYPGIAYWAPTVDLRGTETAALELRIEVRELRERAERFAARSERFHLTLSCVAGRLALAHMQSLYERWDAASARFLEQITSDEHRLALRGPRIQGEPEDALRAIVADWTRATRLLQTICDGRSMHFLHVLQPTLLDEGSKTPTELEVARGRAPQAWIDAARAGYPLMREAGAKLRDSGVNTFDGTRIFQDVAETVYLDAAHLDQTGNDLLAEHVARAFLESMP